MNAKLKVSMISILFLFPVLSIFLSGVTKAAPNPEQTSNAKLSELHRNALQLIKVFQKNEMTSNVANQIENELNKMEQTRIKALRIAERLEFHRINIQRLQNELFIKINNSDQEKILRLQILMMRKSQLVKTLSIIMGAIEDTQNEIVTNMK